MKKIVVVFVLAAAALAASTGFFAYRNSLLQQEIASLESQLEEALNKTDQDTGGTYVDTDDTVEKAAIEDFLYRYVDTLTHCGGDLTYGQAPAVASFLTDNGILEALKEFSPYTDFSDEDIAKVRELSESSERVETGYSFDHDVYVKLSGNTAEAVIIYEGTYTNGYIDTVASYVGGVLEFKLIKDDTNGWLIDETTKELLF